MDWKAILTGIGAIVAGAGGCIIVIREFVRRDRKAVRHEVGELAKEVDDLRHDLLACRSYSFHMQGELATRGIQPPDPPAMRSDQ